MSQGQGDAAHSDHFDAVVVGSGFGASAVACRLAEQQRRVCVLERGKPYPPGSFPRSPRGISRNLWDPKAGMYGMFDIWSFRGIESLVSSGLGGGSLIYANVLIRKDPAWFVDELPGGGYLPWPISYRDLDPFYGLAEGMLGAEAYPLGDEPYRQTPKTLAMREAAESLGLDWGLPPLAVTFRSRPGRPPAPGVPIEHGDRNLHGRPRDTCRLCGECDIGCNYGSKNTLDYTYLSKAAREGAEIRHLAEVRRIEPLDGRGYRISYIQHDPERPRPGVARDALPHTSVTADNLVLGAGTFGTTYLLLRNRSAFPAISPALGTRFSGNGDLLTFLTHSSRQVDGQSVPRWLDPGRGPVITSRIRLPDTLDHEPGWAGRGLYVEDGGDPEFLNWLVDTASLPGLAFRTVRFVLRRMWAKKLGDPRSNVSGDVSDLLGRGSESATWLPLLTMGRDTPDGVMRLRGEELDLDWTTGSSSGYFNRAEETVRHIADALGAALSNTPLWLFKKVITVHPLGGCPMGVNRQEGVVNGLGEVYGCPGLYVVDGSVMPGPVGPNPSLTIAAFAERAAANMVFP